MKKLLVGIVFLLAFSVPALAQMSNGTINAKQSGTWNITLSTGSNTVGKVDQGTAGASAWLVTGTGGVFPATQSGTWTVQPGNTANTTAWLVTFGGNGTVFSGQAAVTASAAALATNTSKGVCVKALVANTINVYIGSSGITTSTGHELAPGDSTCIPANNSNLIFTIASTTGASVSFIGTN